MDIKAIRQYVNDNPDGVLIRMVDGTAYRIPHRDYIWFNPGADAAENRGTRFATSFFVSDDGVGKLVNALLVAEIEPLKKGGSGRGKGRKRSA